MAQNSGAIVGKGGGVEVEVGEGRGVGVGLVAEGVSVNVAGFVGRCTSPILPGFGDFVDCAVGVAVSQPAIISTTNSKMPLAIQRRIIIIP